MRAAQTVTCPAGNTWQQAAFAAWRDMEQQVLVDHSTPSMRTQMQLVLAPTLPH